MSDDEIHKIVVELKRYGEGPKSIYNTTISVDGLQAESRNVNGAFRFYRYLF